jgi:hypothetical protein
MVSNTLEEMAYQFYDGKCRVTREKFKPVGFTLHHIEYIEDDVERKQYPKGPLGTEQYYNDLYPLVEDNPDRFALIKNSIHTKLDHVRNGVCRLNMDNRIRFCELALLTKKRGRS